MKKYGIDNVYASRFDLIDKSAKAHKCMANISKTGKDTQIKTIFYVREKVITFTKVKNYITFLCGFPLSPTEII